ncbi:MAG: threonine synthase [Phycisphaerales bacterium]|nr:threonine synthase [Phycisphaerales bacterium]
MNCFVSHLESAIDGTRLAAGAIQSTHQDRPLWVRYDLSAAGRACDAARLSRRPPGMWRYRELLPLPADVEPVSLGETMTPLLPVPRLGESVGLRDLWIKDESRLPTGSFKSRGMVMAVSMAVHFGLRRFAVPTAGNAGGALAAYGARAGADVHVFMPDDTPVVNQIECVQAGAKTFLVNGLIGDCGRIVREGKSSTGWFDFSTLKEPYRIEGKKTMGLELADQLDWKLPDVILYPTGGGTGLIGMWKAFGELRELGWLRSETMPRMVAVQSDGCAPIVRAFDRGERFAEPWSNAVTCASGLRVPSAIGDFMMLDAIRESRGCAVAVPEGRIVEAMNRSIAATGLPICPESAACVLAAEQLVKSQWLRPDDRVVLFNTAAAQKYATELPRSPSRRIDIRAPIDYTAIVAANS